MILMVIIIIINIIIIILINIMIIIIMAITTMICIRLETRLVRVPLQAPQMYVYLGVYIYI